MGEPMGIVRSRLSFAIAWAALSVTLAAGASFACAQEEQPAGQENPERAIARLVREMQMDLEGSSSTGMLRKIDRAKFEDFPSFRDMVERLTREDTLRVFFRQVSNALDEETARTVLDAEMEMTRKDSAMPAERRRQQITIDLEFTSGGWKIVNITPREFFRPL